MGKTLQEVIDGLPADQCVAIQARADSLIAEEQERLRADIAAGLQDLSEGRAAAFDDAAVERIEQRGREMFAKR